MKKLSYEDICKKAGIIRWEQQTEIDNAYLINVFEKRFIDFKELEPKLKELRANALVIGRDLVSTQRKREHFKDSFILVNKIVFELGELLKE